MTEAEWLACDNPTPMLAELNGTALDRKLRLFACACCRRQDIINLSIYLPARDQTMEVSLTLAENQADGPVSSREVLDARTALLFWLRTRSACCELARGHALICALDIPVRSAGTAESCRRVAGYDSARAMHDPAFAIAAKHEGAVQVNYLRDILGDPFKLVSFDSAWRTATVTSLAKCIYDERRFADLPILADALEDAGCDNRDMLDHCRQPGEHARGCWVVDLVLGKS